VPLGPASLIKWGAAPKLKTADWTAAVVQSADVSLTGCPAARATWGGCLLANAPDLFVWKWVPVCNLRSPLPFLSWGF